MREAVHVAKGELTANVLCGNPHNVGRNQGGYPSLWADPQW